MDVFNREGIGERANKCYCTCLSLVLKYAESVCKYFMFMLSLEVFHTITENVTNSNKHFSVTSLCCVSGVGRFMGTVIPAVHYSSPHTYTPRLMSRSRQPTRGDTVCLVAQRCPTILVFNGTCSNPAYARRLPVGSLQANIIAFH